MNGNDYGYDQEFVVLVVLGVSFCLLVGTVIATWISEWRDR